MTMGLSPKRIEILDEYGQSLQNVKCTMFAVEHRNRNSNCPSITLICIVCADNFNVNKEFSEF